MWPVGWVILIGVGIAAGYGAGKMFDGLGKYLSGVVYDNSNNWFN